MEIKARTELEAVNTILECIGEQPTSTLEVSGISEVSLARQLLHNVSRAVQSEGFTFNSEEDYPLAPDVEGFIYIPDNVIKIDAHDRNLDIVQRGNRLYDKTNHTFKFNKTIKCDVVFFLPFEEIPQAAREYITIKAARQFQTRYLGSENLYSLSIQDELEARHRLIDAEVDVGDYSIFDNYSVTRVLRRTK